VETLKKADRILAEDTRHSRNLLSHLGIAGKPMASIEAHVSLDRLTHLLEHLERGEWLALVTDAGMPAVSDPGARFVALVREAGFAVDVIPGPSAVTAAVALSGLVEGPFYFAGFLPRQGGKRTRAIDRVCLGESAAVLFEAPGRVEDTLKDLAKRTPHRRAAVCRELTKLHEEVVTGTLEELAALDREWRGEVVLVLADPGELEASGPPSDAPDDDTLLAALREGKTVRDLADASGLGGKERRAFYTRLLELQKRL
jgi:16S rRNA (cytidine1402-2'-O)-methyltransferase